MANNSYYLLFSYHYVITPNAFPDTTLHIRLGLGLALVTYRTIQSLYLT